jgi:RHS repeat-associated protein
MRIGSLKYLLLAGAALLLGAPPGAAQMGSSRPSFSAPAAASLGRFGEVPVSLHTGQPDITIPLFTAEGRTLELPVALRYQSGGVRLDDVGSWVGMGWALQAGGVITRSVRGLPDDSYYGYYNTGHVFYDPNNWPAPVTSNATYTLFENMRSGFVDGDPDQFFFNFAGRTGQFAIGPTSASSTLKEVVTTPRQNLRIVPQNNFRTWLVTTEDGTRYTFAAMDSTLEMVGTSTATSGGLVAHDRPRFISSWHLTEIRSPGGDVIRLHYSTYIARHRLTNGGGLFYLISSLNNCTPQTTDFVQYNGMEFKANRLDSITSAAHTIRFIPDATLRADALDEGGNRQEPRLAQIEVRTPTGTVLRRFVFDHDYFGGNRLRLKSVQEQDAAGNGLPPWSFDYDPQSFPARGTFSQDHGGFWNGKTNSTLVPAAVGTYTLSDGEHTASMAGANREPDVNFARVGSLSKITYPTGGTSQFIWELHDYGATRHGFAEYDSAGAEQTASVAHNTYVPNSRTATTTFTIGGTQNASVSLEAVLYCTMGMTSCASAQISGPGINQTFTASATMALSLAPGTYTMTATSPTSTQFATASIQVRWRQMYHITGRKPGSGLRIAELRTTDGHGGQEVKKYRYRRLADSTFSSGMMDYAPVYMERVSTNNTIDRCEFFMRTATSVLPLGASSTLAYREVTVLHGENGEFGRTREVFRNSLDNPDGAPLTPRPNIRVTSTEGRSGQRLRATQYNAAGQMQQRTESKYTFVWNDPATTRRFRGMSLARWTGYSGTPGTGYFPIETQYSFGAFEVVSEWGYQSADTVYAYDEAGNASVWTARDYTFGNPAHLQPTQVKESGSDGTVRNTRMRYASDYPAVALSSDPDGLTDGEAYAYALTMMKDSLHMHSQVIERWVSEVVGGTERVLQAELTPYQLYPTGTGGTARSILPAGRFGLDAPGPVTDFAPAFISTAALQWNEGRYAWIEHVNGYDAWGRMREVGDANGALYTYTYGGNANNAFLTGITRTVNGDGGTLTTQAGYDGAGNLTSLLDDGGTLRTFVYDGFARLRQIRDGAGTPLQGFGYTYSRTAGNSWAYQSAAPNAVIDTIYQRHSPSVAGQVNTTYFDGLGRNVQRVEQDGSTWHVTARQYDATGRTWRRWKGYPRTTAGYDPNFAANATAFYNADLGVSSAQPYADSLFTPDPLRRLRSFVPEYVGSSPTAATTLAYGVDAGTGRRYTEVTDESGKKQRNYTDGFGNSVTTVLGYGATEASTAQLSYNALGQRTQLTDPRGIITQYTRNTRGLVTSRVNPDGGNRSHKYDHAGNLRYTQDAVQAAAGQVHFTTYDRAGRALVSGVGAATFASMDPNYGNLTSLESTTANWREVRHYDGKPSTSAFPWSMFATQLAPLALNNVTGRLAATASNSGGVWQADFYSYDADGKIAARYTYHWFSGSVRPTLNTAIAYARDLTGAITQRTLTVGANTFYQWYDYNGRGQLSYLYASTAPTRPATPDAAYTYRSSGKVAQRQFQGGPLVPVRYTIREQMERIGDPASTAYPFSARYSYHPNGQLQEQEFYSAGSPSANKRYGYVFGAGSWDALNRLRGADYSAWTGTGWNTTASNDLTGITYDAAGNLTVLGRYNGAGAVIDNLAYGYGAGSNRLSSVTDYAGATAETFDAENGTFAYDANGNVTAAPQPYGISAATYDHRNLPLSITANGATTLYHYNVDGQRYSRRPSTGGSDVYIKEGPATLAVVTVDGVLTPYAWHFNLLAGDQVIGRVPHTGNRRYYHRDMLGSTRAVVEGATVVESYDYDPFGLLLPHRVLAGPTREGYTGKEQDPQTGLHYYGARYYMAALGRWMNVDPPADSFPSWSPYNYVLGDPVGTNDPTGMTPDPCRRNNNFAGCPIDLGHGYRARIDPAGRGGGGQAGHEIHVYRVGGNGRGTEVGIWGRDGWMDKHHKPSSDPPGMPRRVVERVNGHNVDILRRQGEIRPGQAVRGGAYSTRVAGILSRLNTVSFGLSLISILEAHHEADRLGVSPFWYMTMQMRGYTPEEIEAYVKRNWA